MMAVRTASIQSKTISAEIIILAAAGIRPVIAVVRISTTNRITLCHPFRLLEVLFELLLGQSNCQLTIFLQLFGTRRGV
jgi:hypothetical protein